VENFHDAPFWDSLLGKRVLGILIDAYVQNNWAHFLFSIKRFPDYHGETAWAHILKKMLMKFLN